AAVTNSSDSLDQVRTRLEAAATGRPRAPIRGGGGGGAARGGRGGRGGAGGARGGGGGGAAGTAEVQDSDTQLWQKVHDGQAPLIASTANAASVIQLMRALEPYTNVKLVLFTTGDSAYETVDVLKG